MANYGGGFDTLWLNIGNAIFVDSGQIFPDLESAGVACGDLDGDGDLDVYFSNHYADKVFLNQPYERTPQESTQALIDSTNAMVAAHVLNRSEGISLTVKLRNAITRMDEQNASGAIPQLGAVINEINALIRSRRLTPAQGQPLIDATRAIIAKIMP